MSTKLFTIGDARVQPARRSSQHTVLPWKSQLRIRILFSPPSLELFLANCLTNQDLTTGLSQTNAPSVEYLGAPRGRTVSRQPT